MSTRSLFSRRGLLGHAGGGLLAGAVSGLLGRDALGAPRREGLHHAPRIRRVIHLCMAGGPSHLETLDEKPELARRDGEPMPESFTKGQILLKL